MDPSRTSGRAGSEELSAVSTLPASIDGRKDRQLDRRTFRWQRWGIWRSFREVHVTRIKKLLTTSTSIHEAWFFSERWLQSVARRWSVCRVCRWPQNRALTYICREVSVVWIKNLLTVSTSIHETLLLLIVSEHWNTVSSSRNLLGHSAAVNATPVCGRAGALDVFVVTFPWCELRNFFCIILAEFPCTSHTAVLEA